MRLRPAPHCRTPILSYSIKIIPAKHFINWQQDPYGNHLARLVFPEKTEDFVVEVDLIAELVPINPFDYFLEPGGAGLSVLYTRRPWRRIWNPIAPCSPPVRCFSAFSTASRAKSGPHVGFLVDLNRRVRDEIGYIARLEPGVQTCEETLERRTGSCRDSAWLLVQILRHSDWRRASSPDT